MLFIVKVTLEVQAISPADALKKVQTAVQDNRPNDISIGLVSEVKEKKR